MTKRCPKCKEDKDVLDFYTDPTKKDGLQGYCKKCLVYRGGKKLCPRCNLHRKKFEGDLCVSCTRGVYLNSGQLYGR